MKTRWKQEYSAHVLVEDELPTLSLQAARPQQLLPGAPPVSGHRLSPPGPRRGAAAPVRDPSAPGHRPRPGHTSACASGPAAAPGAAQEGLGWQRARWRAPGASRVLTGGSGTANSTLRRGPGCRSRASAPPQASAGLAPGRADPPPTPGCRQVSAPQRSPRPPNAPLPDGHPAQGPSWPNRRRRRASLRAPPVPLSLPGRAVRG